MTRPNIVWICTDQQRYDSLGCYGNAIARTPNIDSIAATGTRFNQHITPMQMCSPSRATLFTGLFPRNHELIINGMALPTKTPTLTGLLAEAGYRTHSVGKQHLQPILAPAEHNLPDSRAFWKTTASKEWTGPYYGFQTLDLLLGEADTAANYGHYANWLKEVAPEAIELLKPDHAIESPPVDLDNVWSSAIPSKYHYNTWISELSTKFIEDSSNDEPFFLFASYPDPHHPFAPPAEYANRYNPAEMPLPRVDEGELDRLPEYYTNLFPTDVGFRELHWDADPDAESGSMIPTRDVSDESLRRAIANTHAAIEMIDDGVGQILQALERSGKRDNTIIMFTSDHGELLGDHGLLHKGPPSYKQVVQVAMIITGPGIRAGETSDALTSHIDIAPTFLALADVDSADCSFDGHSMMPLLNGEGQWQREANYGEYHPSAVPGLYNQTIRTSEWRLSLYPDNPRWGELFHLRDDPEEHYNLFYDVGYSSIVDQLTRILAVEFPPQRSVDNPILSKW